MIIRSRNNQGWNISIHYPRCRWLPLVMFYKHDNCAGDEVMRERWISIIGWFSTFINWKPHRHSLDIGVVLCGCVYGIFFE